MSDSIQLYTGRRFIDVHNIDILSEPNQQLANAIATGPQDEFFSRLEECNRTLSGFGANERKLSVTPSWNWRPGTLNMIKDYVAQQLMINKKSSGLGKYIERSQENARFRLSWMAQRLTICEELKRELKREGYSLNVDIDEYLEKLNNFCEKVNTSIGQSNEATEGKVEFIPYIHIPYNDERNTEFYIKCYIKEGIMNIYQDNKIIQKIPTKGIKLMFNCKLRQMMRYLDKPMASMRAVHYLGFYDTPMANRSTYRTRQVFQHPYIAMPSHSDSIDGNILWSTACFSDFTDTVNDSFHKLNFTVLAMELLEWSSYYNTSHSNPYNQPTFMHFGMPSNFNKAYQATQNRDTDNCSVRVKGLMQDKKAVSYSRVNCQDRMDIVKHCQDIECIWRTNCNMFIDYSRSLKTLTNGESIYMIESILGAMIEYFDSDTILNVLDEDFGVYIYYKKECKINGIRENSVLTDWFDAINALCMKYQPHSFQHILNEMNYWNIDKENPVTVAEGINQEQENIKRAMLQWATERSM